MLQLIVAWYVPIKSHLTCIFVGLCSAGLPHSSVHMGYFQGIGSIHFFSVYFLLNILHVLTNIL